MGTVSCNSTMDCFTQTCTQKISGRNLKYETILKIIQNEEYLKGMNFHQNIKKNGKPQHVLPSKENKKQRNKRQVVLNNACKAEQWKLVQTFGQDQLCIFPSIPRSNCTLIQLEQSLISGSAQEKCFQTVHLASPISNFDNMALITNVPGPSVASMIATILALFSVSILLSFSSLQSEGQVPSEIAQPGSTFGGGIPTDFSNPTLTKSLKLIPTGLRPLAVFPPFARPRSLPAYGVVFAEKKSISKRMNFARKNLFLKNEDRFGFVVEVTLTENEKCSTEYSCFSNSILENVISIRATKSHKPLFVGKPKCHIVNVC